MSALMGQLATQLIGVVLISIFVGWFVQFACKIVTGYMPPYGMAYMAAFMALLCAALLQFSSQFIGNAFGILDPMALLTGVVVASFMFQCVIYGTMLMEPKKGSIGLGNGILVSALETMFAIILFGFFTLVVGGVLGSFGGLELYRR